MEKVIKVVGKENFKKDFLRGTAVIKIAIMVDDKYKNIDIIKTINDVRKDLKLHYYNPLLYLLPIHLQIAYLYDCLNRSYNRSRNQEYIVLWRKMKTNQWEEWFKIKSYREEDL